MKPLLFLAGMLVFLHAAMHAQAAPDTVRVMSYNVLNYGELPACQGPSGTYHGYLKTIVAYSHPDVLGLVKMGAVHRTPGDAVGNAPYGFGDSILTRALNAAFPGRYAYCPVTNTAEADAISMLFYNQQKLGYLATVINYVRTTDFNVYKFYYKDSLLAQTRDTTYLYVILNHTQSGSGNDVFRGTQITGYLEEVRRRFRHLPNVVNMGDFNTRNTEESCYQALVAPVDTGFRFYDPPFYPDAALSYPADWNSNPGAYSAWLTTSTRQANLPNNCGTTGGAKSWYDHLFFSPWIVSGSNYIRYLPGSYRTLGNDGHRTGISINDNSAAANNSAPGAVIEALFQMSNKYPVFADLLVGRNSTGTSLPDPDLPPLQVASTTAPEQPQVVNPVGNTLHAVLPETCEGRRYRLQFLDGSGRLLREVSGRVHSQIIEQSCTLPPGFYWVQLSVEGLAPYRFRVLKD